MKRHLKPQISRVLYAITAFLTIMVISINDFNLNAVPLILAVVGVIILNVNILERYG